MNWSSAALYDAKIFAHEDVKTRLLTDFEHVRSTDETTAPLVLIDTQGCDLDECKGMTRVIRVAFVYLFSILTTR